MNDKYSNPSSGTVIDNTVTRRNYFDFFLVSQHVRQVKYILYQKCAFFKL